MFGLAGSRAVGYLFFGHGEHRCNPICISDVEQHSFRDLAHHLAGFQVHHEQGLQALDLLRIGSLLFDAGQYGARPIAEGHPEPHQLVGTIDILDPLNGADADIQFRKFFK